MPGPLDDIRIIDLSSVVSGPFAAMWLADQGADVIKVEDTRLGDNTRGNSPGALHHGLGGLYVNCNRGKRAIAVDLSAQEGRDIVLDLCRNADVLIQNWRPGVADRLGVGWDAVRSVNDQLIYLSISGYGPDGPYAQRRVYDPIIQGLSGHVAVQVNPELPIPDLIRTIVCDKATALAAAQAITAALLARARGRAAGQHVEVPMLDVSVAFFFPDGMMAQAFPDDPAAQALPPLAQRYRLQATSDGQLTYFVTTETEFHALFRAVGHAEWSDDARFRLAADRQANAYELGELLDAAFRVLTTSTALAALLAEDVPVGRVLTLDEVGDDEQVRHNQVIRERVHPVLGRVREARPPVRFSNWTGAVQTPFAPAYGENTDEVLADLGYEPAIVASLRERGVVR